ncbi:NAD(P)-dependent alcohol dehydrogenase [Micromonospora profundi]|uniref:NAD(P)-dependent alcohol dehydrogenase n=1 Tax=Micromonospora profundi TaxID=1420889 RepID=A0AAJ6HR69_9ACTN|nr:NAD(P)-dependent alcohol dehydrogenase [Micromonospora profundi]WLS43533.1 NAD(P)-dependent alcohol dehydrogenase [Micromonospora profundi]
MRIRAAVTDTPGGPFVVQAVDLEAPRPYEVLVRMAAAGLCHTDLSMQASWPRRLTPMVFGHEGAGVVEEVGAAVTTLAPGDRVCLTFNSCGACEQCVAGHPAYCRRQGALNTSGGRGDGTTPLSRDGAPVHAGFFGQSSFATFALAHERNAIRVPDDLPAVVAAPLGCGAQTGAGTVLNRLRPEPGSSLVVIGAGGVGLTALMAALVRGCAPVIVIEPVASRRALAVELGATAGLDPGAADLVTNVRDLTGGGAHHIVDTTSRPEMLQQAVAFLRPRGDLALVGVGATVAFDVMSLLTKGIRVHGVIEGDADPTRFIPVLADLHQRGLFPLDRLIAAFAFDNIGDAVAGMRDGSAIKPVLTFG